MSSIKCVRGLPVALCPEALPRYSNLSPGNMGTPGQQTSSLSVAQCALTLSAVLPEELQIQFTCCDLIKEDSEHAAALVELWMCGNDSQTSVMG